MQSLFPKCTPSLRICGLLQLLFINKLISNLQMQRGHIWTFSCSLCVVYLDRNWKRRYCPCEIFFDIIFFLNFLVCSFSDIHTIFLLSYKILFFKAVNHLVQIKPTTTNTNQHCMHTATHTCTSSPTHLNLHQLTDSSCTHICVKAQAREFR